MPLSAPPILTAIAPLSAPAGRAAGLFMTPLAVLTVRSYTPPFFLASIVTLPLIDSGPGAVQPNVTATSLPGKDVWPSAPPPEPDDPPEEEPEPEVEDPPVPPEEEVAEPPVLFEPPPVVVVPPPEVVVVPPEVVEPEVDPPFVPPVVVPPSSYRRRSHRRP